MQIYTIGFEKKSAGEFFGTIRKNGIKRLIDIRLHNTSQLAGFTKASDLPYFLKEICGADYVHETLLAPTEEIFVEYKKQKGAWETFRDTFNGLLKERKVEKKLDKKLFRVPVVLLCSEAKPERCHRKLVADYLASKWKGVDVIHL